jgi:hypothetical protein
MPVLPDWPASPPTVRCGRTSISTVTLLVGGEMPWLTPTETPGAMYFPALSAAPPVADVPVPAGFRVPVVPASRYAGEQLRWLRHRRRGDLILA